MLDHTAEGSEIPPAERPWSPERKPDDLEVLGRALVSVARKPGRLLLLTARTMRDFGQATRNPFMVAAGDQLRGSLRGPLGTVLNLGRARPTEPDAAQAPMPTGRAPRTPFNRRITAHRRFAFRTSSLSTAKEIKATLGATINDVVMAACAGGLRAYLLEHDALPEAPLVAMVPVSIRTGEEAERWTNRVSAIMAVLPTHIDDPVERLRAVNAGMSNAKGLFNAMPAERLTDFAEFPSPAVFTRAMRLSTRLGLGDRLRPVANVVVSNVPGPRTPLYAAGARLRHYYPVSTITDGQGLNITVQSYEDNLDWGLISCRELVPDLNRLLDLIIEDMETMAKIGHEAASA
jgi:WS/DGAT/MGAT family acyltransferase